MNKNLELLMEKLSTDEGIAKEFVKQKTMDDMYEFCLSIVGGYTAEEFDEFACEMLKLANESSAQGNLEDSLNSVAGGKMMPGSKVAAMALAALTTVSGAGMAMVSASGVSKPSAPASQSRSVSKSKGTWQKIKDFCSKNKKWLIGGGIAAGVLTGVAVSAGVIAFKHNKNKVKSENNAGSNLPQSTQTPQKSVKDVDVQANVSGAKTEPVKPAGGGDKTDLTEAKPAPVDTQKSKNKPFKTRQQRQAKRMREEAEVNQSRLRAFFSKSKLTPEELKENGLDIDYSDILTP